jgi:hypothetical protein
MFDVKTLIAMRDEMERIQGGVGIEQGERNQDYIPEEGSQAVSIPSNIIGDMFGEQGPSLGGSALRAMNIASEE